MSTVVATASSPGFHIAVQGCMLRLHPKLCIGCDTAGGWPAPPGGGGGGRRQQLQGQLHQVSEMVHGVLEHAPGHHHPARHAPDDGAGPDHPATCLRCQLQLLDMLWPLRVERGRGNRCVARPPSAYAYFGTGCVPRTCC